MRIGEDKELEAILKKIDLTTQPPAEEPARQYWYMKKCRELFAAREKELGRKLTYHTETFGCPIV